MIGGRYLVSAFLLATGFAVAAGLFWLLLTVPESNLMALTLSVVLAVLAAAVAGITVAGASLVGTGRSAAPAFGQALRAVPAFLIGLCLCTALWWTTGLADSWWTAHRGEIDAAIIRRFNRTDTEWLHTTVWWLLWFVRWAIGLSMVTALVVMSAVRGARTVAGGFRLSVRVLPLTAATLGLLAGSQAFQRAAYWRPANLPPTWIEPAFAGVKLATLYLAVSLIAAAVLRVYTAAATRR